MAMRILFFLPDFDGGGAQRTMINLANAFIAQGHDVTLCAPNADGVARPWVGPDVKVEHFGKRSISLTLLPLVALLRRLKPELVMSTGIDANIVASLADFMLGCRYSLVVRETNSHSARGDIGAFRRLLCRFAYRVADQVVALSEGVKLELMQSYSLPADKITTIHNPVDIERIADAVCAARALPSPVNKTGPLIFGIGRLTRQKGYDRLIKMVAGLGRSDVQLVLLGEGEDRALLSKLAQESGLADRLHMPGFVSDPFRWLTHADLFVLPSRWEGFGHVIVEAMAAGVAVVAYDCPHGPRDIISDGTNGILVRMGDEGAFTQAMRDMLEDRAKAGRMADAAKEGADRFSLSYICGQYLGLFQRALARRAASRI
jgi:glycosyltransferase involved in cell wall biosynthesis